MPGVTASVNLATERARIETTADVSADALIQAVQAAGYQARLRGAEHEQQRLTSGWTSLTARLAVAVALTAVVVAISMIPALMFPGWQLVAAVLTAPVVFYSGWPFHRAAWAALRRGDATMDTLVSLGALVSFAWSIWVIATVGIVDEPHTFTLIPNASDSHGSVYFETSAVLVTLILLGRWIEDRSRTRAGAALAALEQLMPREVRILQTAEIQSMNLLAPTRSERMVKPEALQLGMTVVVLPGERVPVDGVVIDGAADVDESAITGESAPRQISTGTPIYSGTLVLNARVHIRVTHVGADTRMAQLAELVERAQVSKSSVQRLADRISSVFVPVVIALAAATATYWLVTGHPIEHALTIAIAVIIIACPCALGLATPVAIMAGTGRGAQLGIILSNPDVLERAAKVRTVALDKTGTLTTGVPQFESLTVDPASGLSPDEVFLALVSVESGSEHPFATAIAREAAKRNISPVTASDSRVQPGSGITATVQGEAWTVSRTGESTLPAELSRALAASTGSAAVISRGGRVVGLVTVTDELKSDAVVAISQIRSMGSDVTILSGDRDHSVQAIASRLQVTNWTAGMTPEQKVERIAQLTARHRVAMVGDGINDAAALATADIGIAMAGGTDLARAAGDITVTSERATAIPQALRLAAATARTIRGNLAWAFAYNVAAIPLAMAGYLNPMIAAAAMAFSSLFVVLNSVRLVRFSA